MKKLTLLMILGLLVSNLTMAAQTETDCVMMRESPNRINPKSKEAPQSTTQQQRRKSVVRQ